jgi:hypothetical protein
MEQNTSIKRKMHKECMVKNERFNLMFHLDLAIGSPNASRTSHARGGTRRTKVVRFL